MWFNVAWIEGKKPVRDASNSTCVSLAQAASKRWFAHALLYAIARRVWRCEAGMGSSGACTEPVTSAVALQATRPGFCRDSPRFQRPAERALLCREPPPRGHVPSPSSAATGCRDPGSRWPTENCAGQSRVPGETTLFLHFKRKKDLALYKLAG